MGCCTCTPFWTQNFDPPFGKDVPQISNDLLFDLPLDYTKNKFDLGQHRPLKQPNQQFLHVMSVWFIRSKSMSDEILVWKGVGQITPVNQPVD